MIYFIYLNYEFEIFFYIFQISFYLFIILYFKGNIFNWIVFVAIINDEHI